MAGDLKSHSTLFFLSRQKKPCHERVVKIFFSLNKTDLKILSCATKAAKLLDLDPTPMKIFSALIYSTLGLNHLYWLLHETYQGAVIPVLSKLL